MLLIYKLYALMQSIKFKSFCIILLAKKCKPIFNKRLITKKIGRDNK
jgi:hypothetical protein